MNLTPVLSLIRARTGMDPATLGATAVRLAVEARCRVTGAKDAAEYANRAAADRAELSALIDEVVVPETWFFRGGALFDWVADHVVRLRQSRPTSPVRVLSVPCSTGEEPYSLAIALAERGAPESASDIVGVDLSARNVEAAGRGTFPDLSFRQTPPARRSRWFAPDPKEPAAWHLAESVRRRATFRVGNVLDETLLAGGGTFDLVFCRNLFIYLPPESRKKALANLARLLRPDGLLCLGHADALDGDAGGFTRAGPAEFFLYRRADAPATRAVAPVAVARPTPVVPARPAATVVVPPPAQRSLTDARKLADAGDYAGALDVCRAMTPSADLYTLEGEVHQARGDLDLAVRTYHKALYLDPSHAEALLHLELFYNSHGDAARAATYRARRARLAAQAEG